MARKSSSPPSSRSGSRSAKPKGASSRRSSFSRAKAALWLNVLVLIGGGGWYLLQPPARQTEVRQLLGNAFADNKRVQLVDVAWDLYQLYYSPDFVAAPPVAGDRTYLYAGAPRFTDALVSDNGVPAGRYLPSTGYVVGYSDALASPLWAAYRMTDINPLPAPAERPESFDVDIRTVARVDSDAYTGSGYDRGHLAPNYAIATRFGATAQRETFLMSNVMPQRHGLNAGLWKQLELRAATSYPARFGDVWVIAGPVFGAKPDRLPGSARPRPAIPDECFMILVDESDGRVRTLAFVFPQEPRPNTELGDYLTTIDAIELRTGLDFLADLPDEAEADLESRRAARAW